MKLVARRLVALLIFGPLMLLPTACVGPGGVSYQVGIDEGFGPDYYQPFPYAYGGWGPDYGVGPYRYGGYGPGIGGGGRFPHAYRSAPPSRSLPSIPMRGRGDGGRPSRERGR